MGYREEFGPDFKIEPEIIEFLESNGWKDTSYGNDVAPSFKKGNHKIWLDEENPEARDFSTALRYTLTFEKEGEDPVLVWEEDLVSNATSKLERM